MSLFKFFGQNLENLKIYKGNVLADFLKFLSTMLISIYFVLLCNILCNSSQIY